MMLRYHPAALTGRYVLNYGSGVDAVSDAKLISESELEIRDENETTFVKNNCADTHPFWLSKILAISISDF